uniref:Calcineurin-like phosphoesterase domain-containing protein n=1 Tax=viral metagenome TaxID=1070528 RepID=A0A6C0H802_9ZZZZ
MYNCKYVKYKMKYENKYINEDIETNRNDLFNAIQKLIDPYYFEDLKKYFTLKKIDIMIINLNHYKSLHDSINFHNSCKIYSLIDDEITKIDVSLENTTLTQFIFHFLFIIYHFSKNDIAWHNFFNKTYKYDFTIVTNTVGVQYDASSRLRRIKFDFFHNIMGINAIKQKNKPIYFNVDYLGDCKIGIISDTHGYIKESLDRLGTDIDILIHAGDMSYEESRSIDGDILNNFLYQVYLKINKDSTIEEFKNNNDNVELFKYLNWFWTDPELFIITDLYKSLEYLNNLNIPVYFVGGNHDYILEQLGLIFGHQLLADTINQTFPNLYYLYTEMTSPLDIKNITIMNKPVKIWGTGITVFKEINELQPVKSGNNSFQFLTRNIPFTSKHDSLTELLNILPINHFLHKSYEEDTFNIIVTHSPIYIESYEYQTRFNNKSVFKNLIKDIFITAKGNMHISGHSHRNTNEDPDIKPFIYKFDKLKESSIIANVPVVNIWNGFEGFPVIICELCKYIIFDDKHTKYW